MKGDRPNLLIVSNRSVPTFFPAFQAGVCRVATSKREYPIAFLHGQNGRRVNAQDVVAWAGSGLAAFRVRVPEADMACAAGERLTAPSPLPRLVGIDRFRRM